MPKYKRVFDRNKDIERYSCEHNGVSVECRVTALGGDVHSAGKHKEICYQLTRKFAEAGVTSFA